MLNFSGHGPPGEEDKIDDENGDDDGDDDDGGGGGRRWVRAQYVNRVWHGSLHRTHQQGMGATNFRIAPTLQR